MILASILGQSVKVFLKVLPRVDKQFNLASLPHNVPENETPFTGRFYERRHHSDIRLQAASSDGICLQSAYLPMIFISQQNPNVDKIREVNSSTPHSKGTENKDSNNSS